MLQQTFSTYITSCIWIHWKYQSRNSKLAFIPPLLVCIGFLTFNLSKTVLLTVKGMNDLPVITNYSVRHFKFLLSYFYSGRHFLVEALRWNSFFMVIMACRLFFRLTMKKWAFFTFHLTMLYFLDVPCGVSSKKSKFLRVKNILHGVKGAFKDAF